MNHRLTGESQNVKYLEESSSVRSEIYLCTFWKY